MAEVVAHAEELPHQPTNTVVEYHNNNHQKWNHNTSTGGTTSSETSPGHSWRLEAASSSNDSLFEFGGVVTDGAKDHTLLTPPHPFAQATLYVQPRIQRHVQSHARPSITDVAAETTRAETTNNLVPLPLYGSFMPEDAKFADGGQYLVTAKTKKEMLMEQQYLRAFVECGKRGCFTKVTIYHHDGGLAAILDRTNDSPKLTMRFMSAQDCHGLRLVRSYWCHSWLHVREHAVDNLVSMWPNKNCIASEASFRNSSDRSGVVYNASNSGLSFQYSWVEGSYKMKAGPEQPIHEAHCSEERIPYQPDAVGHMQTVAMRLLAREVEQHPKDFRVSSIYWEWGSGSTTHYTNENGGE